MSHPLPLTGERTLPGVRGEEYWFARHEAVYRWIAAALAARVHDAVVIEAGSGEGYGAEILRAAGARAVVALEVDPSAAAHSARTYPDVSTVRANLAALPVAPGGADLVVCLQVVEHLWDLPRFLHDVAGLLRPGGLLVVSTPNRPVFSPGLGRGERPLNPFHVEELDADQLESLLLDAGLSDVRVLGLHHSARITAWEARHGCSVVAEQVASLTGGRDAVGDLDEFVSGVRADDFLLATSRDAQDLVATAERP